MEGKFNIWQKCLEIVCFVLILASSIYKGLFCDGDMGVVITLSFVAILLFIIFSINILYRILFYTNLFPVLSVVSGVPRKIIKTSLYKRINLWYYSLVKLVLPA